MPIAMTWRHLVSSSDVAASGDTLVLVYREGNDIGGVIYANVSFDGGETWQGEKSVSESPQNCVETTVASSLGIGHVAWSDDRDDSTNTNGFEAYYDRGNLDTNSVGIVRDGSGNAPQNIPVSAYPNPFNSYVTMKFYIPNDKGGELSIYNIGGQLVKTFNLSGKEAQINWDACDAKGNKVCSGIYFARVSTPQTAKTIKLVLLK
jgi:hypothetical protein